MYVCMYVCMSVCIHVCMKFGRRGLQAVVQEYKNIKTKAAMKLYQNPDPSISAVRMIEDQSVRTGRQSMIKDARKNAEELGVQLQLVYPEPKCMSKDGEEVEGKKVKECLPDARQKEARATVKGERLQGKRIRENGKTIIEIRSPVSPGSNFGRWHQLMSLLAYKSCTSSYY